jgi:glycerate 2-kinase
VSTPAHRSDARALLRRLFDAAIASAQPAVCVPPHLPNPPRGRVIVVGAGKASAAMARAVEDHWPGPLSGLVVTRHGYAVPCKRIEIVEAAHPVPDAVGMRAAERMIERVSGLSKDDLVLSLISGGGSSLLPLPAAGLTLRYKQDVNRELLVSGATIGEINCVRRHLSAIKGGRLAAACHPARVLTLLISDVPGDRPVDIASGPTVADPTTSADALSILLRYRIELPGPVRELLESGRGESVKPGDPRLARAEVRIIATPQMALEAAARVAGAAGIAPHILGDAIEGEAREVGRVLAGVLREVDASAHPLPRPCCIIAGGETTVTVRGQGLGGRNQELCLSAAFGLRGLGDVLLASIGTDGNDGPTDAAGAFVDGTTVDRAAAHGLNPALFLTNNDSYTFFDSLGDLIRTGPTNTNVNDLYLLFAF